jgi:hypothetical protein
MCGTIDPGSCIWWEHGFGIKTGYDKHDDGFVVDLWDDVSLVVETLDKPLEALSLLLYDTGQVPVDSWSCTCELKVADELSAQVRPWTDRSYGKPHVPCPSWWWLTDGQVVCHDVWVPSSSLDGEPIHLKPLSWLVDPSYFLISDGLKFKGQHTLFKSREKVLIPPSFRPPMGEWCRWGWS